MSDTDPPLWISVGPEEGLGLGVVPLDVRQELPLEIERRGEDPTSDATPLELTEPQLHLIEPRTVRRRVVEVHPRMPRQPGLDLRGLVGREIRANDGSPVPVLAPG